MTNITLDYCRLGIDVGGTNTDGVLLDADLNVIAKVKPQPHMIFQQGSTTRFLRY